MTSSKGSSCLLSFRAVPEFGSGRNPAFFTNPADIRLWPKLGRISNFAGLGKLS